MIIAIPQEILPGENRVAIVPDVAAKLIKAGFEIRIEKDAGIDAGFTNKKYEAAGVKVISDLSELYNGADIVLKVQRPLEHPDVKKDEIELIKEGTLLITFLYPLFHYELAKKCAEGKINVISMDMIPRTSLAQKMDALSSQANIAGYKSVLMCANELGKIFPLMMTAAGTISPAKVVIMGAGVAGLQALGTAKRLGAVVEVSDIRSAVKEEVHSLGGKFIEVETTEEMQDESGYAKEASEEFLKKQKELIAVGISVVIDCESCMEWHINQAATAGASKREVLEAVEVGIEFGGGPATVSARFALEVMEHVFKE